MKIIKQAYEINSPVEKVWEALVDPKKINGWGGGPAKMSADKGFEFSLWDGEIYGENLDVIPEKLLVQEWWSKTDNWDASTKATFKLTSRNGKTKLELIHENVPDKSESDIDSGWKDFYLGPLKAYLESK